MRSTASLLTRVSVVIGGCAIVLACGGRSIFVPPKGPGTPAPDAPSAWDAATKECRDARTVISSLRVSGRVGSTRVWPLTVDAAVVENQSIYLGATASGRPIFLLVGTPARATLWLRTENRAVTAAPTDILNALVGVSLSPDDLLAVLSGCAPRSESFVGGVRQGGLLAIETPGGHAFIEQTAGQWALRAFEGRSYTAEFVPPGRSIPQDSWIWSGTGASSASLHLTVQERTINGVVPAEALRVPAAAQAAAPMTLEELAAMWKNRTPENRPWPAP